MEMLALSKRAMGQFVFAATAASMKRACEAFGTFACTSSWMRVRVPARCQILHCGSCGRFDSLRVKTGKIELIGQGHGKTAAQRCGDQLVRVGSDAFRETCAKRILRVSEHATFGRDRAGSFPQAPFPDDRSVAMHDIGGGNFAGDRWAHFYNGIQTMSAGYSWSSELRGAGLATTRPARRKVNAAENRQ
jgi:hypothetical protein